jgi:hypothetical protein
MDIEVKVSSGAISSCSAPPGHAQRRQPEAFRIGSLEGDQAQVPGLPDGQGAVRMHDGFPRTGHVLGDGLSGDTPLVLSWRLFSARAA